MEVFRFGATSQARLPMESWSFRATPQVSFPTELWSQIFEDAAFIPGVLDTEILDPFESGVPTPLTLCPSRATVKLSLHTIYCVILTCKAWHNAALPLLYRFIFIENHNQAIAIHSILRASQEQARVSPNGAASLNSRVRHLMLSFNTNDTSITVSYAFRHALLEIVRLLPNLEILSGVNRLSRAMVRDLPRVPYRGYVVTALMEACETSLRRISFDGDAGMLIIPSVRDVFLNSFPHLQTITGGGSLLDCSIRIPEVTHPNVTTLMIESTDSSCLTPHHTSQPPFPRVTQAILRLTAAQPRTTSWEHFLKVHGAQLRTVHIDAHEGPLTVSPTGAGFADRDLLTQHCPQLASAHLIVRHAKDLRLLPHLPPALRRLGIATEALDAGRGIEEALAAAADIAPPMLEVLRFTNAGAAGALRRYMSSSLVQEFSPLVMRRVRLEDYQGRDLLLPA